MESARVRNANWKSGVTAGEPAHPHRLIVAWRAAIEAAARKADIAIGGPYRRTDTVHDRRVSTLSVLRCAREDVYERYLVALELFDRAAARGDAESIQTAGTALVTLWTAVPVIHGDSQGYKLRQVCRIPESP
jgi:hypothetical protein